MEKSIASDDYYIWQDREVRFDIQKSQIALRNGELVFETIPNVEDTKGSNGDIGILIFTNLRLIWYCKDNIKLNLSVGYECILSNEVRSTTTKLAGETQAFAIKCKFNSNRFEFVFNSVSNNSPQLYSQFNQIFKNYDTSRLYRDIKIKGFLTNDKNLITLPGEKIISKMSGVASINNDQATNGSWYMTNIRLVWYSTNSDNFNLSLPWIQIKFIKTKDFAKNGKCISIESGRPGILNVFYFKFQEKPEVVLKEIEANYSIFISNPIFGIDSIKKDENKNKESVNGNKLNKTASEEINKLSNFNNEDVEVIETNYFNEHSNILYYMTSNGDKKNAITDITFCPELGLAIEKNQEKCSIENLWKIII